MMRRFRDEWLIQRSWGNRFITCYYRVGPRIARRIALSRPLRKLAYLFIVFPAASVAERLIRKADG
jgi:small-conductance mechanosensitive channel